MGALSQFIANIVKDIIQPLIALIFALALFLFASGIIGFLLNSGDPKARENGRRVLMWGVVGLFIMVSAVAILAAITRSFCDGHVFCIMH